uniref:Uncharacterized protein n=1 Tax=Cucumis sativus TaxID=3659 RepID=A0A0A0L017_CUCSA
MNKSNEHTCVFNFRNGHNILSAGRSGARGGGGGGGGGGSASEDTEKPSRINFLLIQEQIIGRSESTVSADDGETGGESRNKNRSNAGEKNNTGGENNETNQDLAISEVATKQNKRLIGGAEEIEEDPRAKKGDQEEERGRIGEK